MIIKFDIIMQNELINILRLEIKSIIIYKIKRSIILSDYIYRIVPQI